MQIIKASDRMLSPRKTAILLMVCAAMSFPAMDTMAKHLSQSQPSFQIVWARYTGQFLLILLIFLPRLKSILPTAQPGLQLARSMALFGGTCFFFLSLRYLDVGQTSAIFQIAPLMITALAALFLKEVIGIRRILCLVGGFAGALIIIQPTADNGLGMVGFLPVVAASFYAVYSVLTRLVKEGESAQTTLFYTAGFGAVISTLILPFIWVTPQSGLDVILMMSMSLFGSLGHYCVIQALARAEASDMAPLNYLSLVFAMFWGFLVFAEVPNASTLCGAVLVVGSGLYVWARTRQKTSP